MKLSTLLGGIGFQDQKYSRDPEILRIVHDSRLVQQGDLFCCIPGLLYDGHEFALDAVKAGAAAVVAEKPLNIEVPLIETTSSVSYTHLTLPTILLV